MRLFGLDGDHDRTRIRALRARPRGRASTDEDRRRVFCAALGQFDELLTAAEVTGAAASPLPLYYALNQASRGIIAARQQPGRLWEPRLHGLTVGDPERGLQSTPIRPQKAETGGFLQLAEALDAERLAEPTYLQNVWAAIPNLPKPGLGAGCPKPLPLEAPSLSVAKHVTVRKLDFIHPGDGAADAVRQYICDVYPRAADGLQVLHAAPEAAPFEGTCANLVWTRTDGLPWHRASAMEYLGGYYLVPALNDAGDVLHRPILLWWCLLLTLSSLARYQSADWAEALQPDNSPWCVAIEQTLSMALQIVPRLVLTELLWPAPV